jgi:transposase
MAYIQGEGRSQGTFFPIVLDDLIPADHICRVIDAFVTSLCMTELDFERSQAAETGMRSIISPASKTRSAVVNGLEVLAGACVRQT